MAWSELLVDVFFVAVFFTLDGSAAAGADYLLLFSVFWQHKFSVTIYAITRDTRKDTFSGKTFRFIHLFLLGMCTLSMPFVFDDAEGTPFGTDRAPFGALVFGLANAASRLTRVVQWRAVRPVAASHVLCGAMHIALYFVPVLGRRLLLGGTVAVDWAVIAGVPVAFDPADLQEHFATFSSILLGDMLLGAVVAAADDPMARLLESCATFVIVFALWWIYFDDIDASIFQDGRATLFAWMLFHWSFHYFLTYSGKVLAESMTDADGDGWGVSSKTAPETNVPLFMFGMMLIQSSLLKMVQLFAGSRHNPVVVFSRCANGGVLFILAVLPVHFGPKVVYAVLCAVLAGQVLVDVRLGK